VANDWTQAIGGKGDRSQIARFIHYSNKDAFMHEPLLRGTNCDGFLGWHAERDMLQAIRSAFTVNLPTKFLQHFQLLRQEGGKAWFTDGAWAEFDGQVAKIYGVGGKLVNSCRYEKPNTRPVDNLCFIPWVPGQDAKIYHWNDNGGDTVWDVPLTWNSATKAYLYRLTDLGRVFEREVPMAGGKVSLQNIKPKTPYVLYKNAPAALPDMKWGEGGLVQDPGFDSHSFYAWKPDKDTNSIRFENTDFGQTELAMDGKAAASVSQDISGLAPGQEYAASVWFSIKGRRAATLKIESAPEPPPFSDRQAWMLRNVPRSARGQGAPRMFDGDPKTSYVSAKPEEANRPVGHNVEAQMSGRHADPTIVLGNSRKKIVSGFAVAAPPELGDGTIKTFYAEISGGGQTESINGALDYGPNGRAAVYFKRPIAADEFKLVATSVVNDTNTVAIAELEILEAEVDAAKAPNMVLGSRTVDSTALINFTDQSSKYERNWHRMKAVFTAPADGRVKLSLQTAPDANGAEVRFDDVRLVKTAISQPPATARNVVLFEDFENVDEGWGPFMYGWKGPMNTHLSEANPPYTKDVISGSYSLKSRLEDSPGMLYRTVPATLQLKPNTAYRATFDVMNDEDNLFAFVAGVDTATGGEAAMTQMIEKTAENAHKPFTVVFTTDNRPDWFIGITKVLPPEPQPATEEGRRRRAPRRAGTIIIDNLLIEEINSKARR
jgi:hypothetical protein